MKNVTPGSRLGPYEILSRIGSSLPKSPMRRLSLPGRVTAFVQELRQAELYKVPGIAETLEYRGSGGTRPESRFAIGTQLAAKRRPEERQTPRPMTLVQSWSSQLERR